VPRLALYDIADTAGFVGAIVNRSGLTLSWSDREDLEQYLLATAWEISLTFEPGKGSVGFSTYAGNILRRRTHDWVRQQNGRTVWKFKGHTYERPPRKLTSLDGPDRDTLVKALAEGNGDREADRDEAVGGLFATRNSERARDYNAMGLEPS
jgi:DNA-directed RNA polymerase specialized sigma24 family protein